jgi:hypothetical protein
MNRVGSGSGPELPVGPSGVIFNVTFSPDGRHMAYESPGPNYTLSLHTLELATGAVTPQAPSVFSHTWSPRGPTLFYSAPVGAGKHGIYRRRFDALDLGPQQLTDGGPEPGSSDLNPMWIASGLSLPKVDAVDGLPPAVGLVTGEAPPEGATTSARRRERALVVVDPSGVRRLRVALARRVGGRCRPVRRSGRVGARRPCAAVPMRTVGPDGLARLSRGLPAGRYVARLRLRDGSGNTARRARSFRVRR